MEGTARVWQQQQPPPPLQSSAPAHHALPANVAAQQPHKPGGEFQNFSFAQSQSLSGSGTTPPPPENFDCLARFAVLNPRPYSPEPASSASLSDPISNSNANSRDASMMMEEKDSGVSNNSSTGGSSHTHAIPLPPSTISRQGGGHRRSNSDIPFGFNYTTIPSTTTGGRTTAAAAKGIGKRKSEEEVGDDLFNTYMNLDNFNTLNLCCVEGSKKSGGDNNSDDNGVECSSSVIGNTASAVSLTPREGVKRVGVEGDRTARHYRSVSMDSFMGNLNFADDSVLTPLPSLTSAKLGLDHGHGEFSAAQLEKIVANEKLAEIASSDPKRAKRILANRVSAARSKERKTRYISELEHKVQTLQTEATTLSAQVTLYQRDLTAITSQNKELKFRVEAMGQQAQLKDALNQALSVEVQRLRLAAAELKGETQPSNRTWPAASLQMTHQRSHPQSEEHNGRAGKQSQ